MCADKTDKELAEAISKLRFGEDEQPQAFEDEEDHELRKVTSKLVFDESAPVQPPAEKEAESTRSDDDIAKLVASLNFDEA